VYAAAGGVGSAAIQVARTLGARVIAAVGSAEKLDVCRSLGADEAFVYGELPEDIGADVVVDPVGGQLFASSFARLRPLGTVIAIGSAAGAWPQIEPARLVGRNVGLAGFYLGRLLRLDPLQGARVARGEQRAPEDRERRRLERHDDFGGGRRPVREPVPRQRDRRRRRHHDDREKASQRGAS